MNIHPQAKLLLLLGVQKTQARYQGFTLLELIIVFVILTILALASLPITLAQIGRARESGAKMNMSSIGISQQEYFFENSSFASQMSQLSVGINDAYYVYPDPTILPSGLVVKHEAQPINSTNLNTRHYSLGIYYNSDRSYTVRLCQSSSPTTLAEVGNTPTSDCISGTLQY